MFWIMDNIVNICPPLWIALLTSSVTTVTHMTEPTSVHRYPLSEVCTYHLAPSQSLFEYTGCFFSHWYPPKPRLGESTLT